MNAEKPAAPAAAPTAQLPFDPRRLLGGMLARRRWIVLATLATALLGLGVGFLRSSTRYEVAVRLIKRDVSGAFRAGEIGEVFKPRAINNATLIGAALSDNVLARVAAKSPDAVPLSLLRLSVEAKELRGTDFVLLTISGFTSRDATVTLANLWGQEIVEFSRELQVRESREVRTNLQQQVDLTDAELTRVNREILDLSRREGLINADKQIDAYLRSLSDLDLRFQTARIELQTAEFRLRNLETELARLNPLRDKLAGVQRELEDALNRYAAQNPVVIELRERAAKLQTELAQQKEKDFDPASAATSTLGSALFLQSLELKAQCAGYTKQLAELDQLRTETRKQLESVPEKSAQLARLLQTHSSLDTARGMLFARLREARHFEEKAPGYFQLFSAATPDAVAVRPRWLKLLVSCVAGLIAGLGAGALGAAGWELVDSRLRTAAEAQRVYRAPVWTVLSAGATAAEWRSAVEHLWLQWMPTHDRARPLAVWSPRAVPAEEMFWAAVIDESRRLLDGMLIVDAGEVPSARLAALPAAGGEGVRGVQSLRIDPAAVSLSEVQRVIARLAGTGAAAMVCVRFSGAVREPATTLARACAPALVFVAADADRLDVWAEHARVLRTAIQPPAGLLVADQARLFHHK